LLKIKQLKINWSYILLGFLLVMILLTRSIPYFLHGSFGFGYDLGIYKKVFESIVSFSDILNSEIYFLPASLGYVFNLLHLNTNILLYPLYISFSAFTGLALYKLTKQIFSKEVALISVFLFAISYIQIFGSNFYLYKAFLGAGMMLMAFYYYSKKSYWFYLFALLLAVTQLPQFLLLAAGVGLSALITLRKDIKFNLIGLSVLISGLLFLLIFTPHHLINGWNIVWDSISGAGIKDNYHTGYFMEVAYFFKKEAAIFIFGLLGLLFSYKNQKARSVQIALIAVISIILFQKIYS